MVDKRIRIILDSKSAEKNAKDLDRAVTNVGGSADKTQFSMTKLASVISAVIAAKQVLDYADAWTKVQNQLRRTVDTTEQLASISGKLLVVSNQTRSGLDATVDLYTSLYLSTENLGLSQENLIGVTKTINNLFLESGKSAAESAGAIRQLGQALQSGALRGDEFNSVAEGAPGILRAIQKETGLTRGQLRKLAEEGKITADLIVTSLQNYSDTAQEAADKTQVTLEQALVTSKNTFIALVGAIDSGTGASKSLAEALQSVAEKLGSPEILDGIKRYSKFFGETLANGAKFTQITVKGLFDVIEAGFTDKTVQDAFDDYITGFDQFSESATKAFDAVNKPFSMVPAPAGSSGGAIGAGFTPVKMKGDGGLQAAIDRENSARQEIQSAQNLTKQLQAELDYRTEITRIYRDNEISGQMGYYDQQRAMLEISIQEDLAKMQNKAIEDQLRRSEAFARAMENEALEREERDLIRAEFDSQEILATEILEQEKTAIKDREKKAREELDKAEWQSRLDNAAMLGGALMQLGQGQSKKIFKIGQTLALAQAAVALPSAVLQSFQNGGGYPWGLVPAAAMLATGLKNIQQIRSAGAGLGGGGGGSPSASLGSGGTGSSIPTTANSAEQVQQKRIIELRGIRPGDTISGEQLASIFESDDNVVVAFENARSDAQRRNVIGVTAR